MCMYVCVNVCVCLIQLSVFVCMYFIEGLFQLQTTSFNRQRTNKRIRKGMKRRKSDKQQFDDRKWI